ncbi:MAG TPA: hypothetical protein VH062_14150 [Polyangiaceae bacterium]|nr:hypothetical protein [Polyangiaceae bacterium]
MTSPRTVRLAAALSLSGFLSACGASRSNTAPQSAPAAAPVAPVSAPAMDRAADAPASAAGAAPAAEGAAMPSSTKSGAAKDAPSELDLWGRQMESALTLSTPDCSLAWALRDRICDLAQRVCDVAGRSAEPEVAERCTDGRARCDHATTRVRAACPD